MGSIREPLHGFSGCTTPLARMQSERRRELRNQHAMLEQLTEEEPILHKFRTSPLNLRHANGITRSLEQGSLGLGRDTFPGGRIPAQGILPPTRLRYHRQDPPYFRPPTEISGFGRQHLPSFESELNDLEREQLLGPAGAQRLGPQATLAGPQQAGMQPPAASFQNVGAGGQDRSSLPLPAGGGRGSPHGAGGGGGGAGPNGFGGGGFC